jgi:2-polyprenyl-3-methyl-5-hydroxy-6-metoxy-1,4-benzoquinol methylase
MAVFALVVFLRHSRAMKTIPKNLPTTDPGIILQLRDRQYAAELIATALEHFDLFSWLSEREGISPQEIASQLGVAERPLDVLLTLCRAYGFVEGVELVRLTELGREHLVKSSPWFLGPYFSPIRDTPIVESFLKVLKTGKPANWQAKDSGGDWHESMKDPGFAQEFLQLMNCRGLLFGQKLAEGLGPLLGERTRLLDVGGGSGIYSATMCSAHPQVSAVVLEQEPVDEIVRAEIARHGLSACVEVVTGDMFEDRWPEAEIVLLSNVLHDWDVAEIEMIVKKAAEALTPGGLLVIHDAFIADDKSGPVEVAEYSALLMNITQGKCYSAAEYAALMEPLGFDAGEYYESVSHRGWMTAVRR